MCKKKTMRAAALLLALVLITSCFVGGTFAKYITSVTDTDNTRIAHWGFWQRGVRGWAQSPWNEQFDLFDTTYDVGAAEADQTVVSGNGDNVVAPGTTKEAKIRFIYMDSGIANVDAPEVDYNLSMAVTLNHHELIGEVHNVSDYGERLDWYLQYTKADGTVVKTEYETHEEMMKALAGLTGGEVTFKYDEETKIYTATATKKYEAGSLPEWLTKDNTLTIGWDWDFARVADATWDEADTFKGNVAARYDDADKMILTLTVVAEQIN